MFGQAKWVTCLRSVILDLVAAAQSSSLLPDFQQCMRTNRASERAISDRTTSPEVQEQANIPPECCARSPGTSEDQTHGACVGSPRTYT